MAEERKHTPGPWRAVSHGGDSTVLVGAKPARNDTRIPAYAYDERRGHCVGYPFLDENGATRWDFICFAHADARLIAAAPDLLAALEGVVKIADRKTAEFDAARAAIKRATEG